MRILCSSIDMVSTSYTHLGYSSASMHSPPEGPAPEYTYPGASAMVVGLVVAATLGRRHVAWLATGVLVALAGIMLANAAPIRTLPAWRGPVHRTEYVMSYLSGRIFTSWSIEEIPSGDIYVLKRQLGLKSYEIRDGWFHDMRLSRRPNARGFAYAITSSGKDGVFGNSDDMSMDASWFDKRHIVRRQQHERASGKGQQ